MVLRRGADGATGGAADGTDGDDDGETASGSAGSADALADRVSNLSLSTNGPSEPKAPRDTPEGWRPWQECGVEAARDAVLGVLPEEQTSPPPTAGLGASLPD